MDEHAAIADDSLDQDLDSDVYEDDFDDEVSGAGKRHRRRALHCFHCNRQESHFLKYQRSIIYSFAVGLTFGLIYLIGPYGCQCCGYSRLMRFDWLNLRMWFRQSTHRSSSRRKRKRSRRSKR